MAVNLSPVGGVAAQFFDNNGVPLAGGKLYTYAAGTTTPVTAYTSSQGVTAWSNPIILNSAGRVSGSGEIWITDGILYKFVLETSTGVLIATYDNISGINSNFISFTNQQEIVTATASQTVFNLGISYQPGTNSLSVFVDGVNQYGPGAQYAYTETDSDTVTFTSGLHVGAEVKFTTTQQQGAGVVDASQVTYDPPFANSVATNVEAKLAQTVSVMDFGAVGDGVTDDYAAITAAILTGKSIYFPSTYTFLVSDTLIPEPDTAWFGYGATVLGQNNDPVIARIEADHAAYPGNKTLIKIFGLKVNGGGFDGPAVKFTKVSNIDLIDMEIFNRTAASGVGIELEEVYWWEIIRPYIYDCALHCIHGTDTIISGSNQGGVYGGRVIGNNQAACIAIKIKGSQGLKIVNVDVEGSGNGLTGIQLQGCEGAQINGCYIELWTDRAIDLSLGGNRRVVITSNVVNSGVLSAAGGVIELDTVGTVNLNVAVSFNRGADLAATQTLVQIGNCEVGYEFNNDPANARPTSNIPSIANGAYEVAVLKQTSAANITLAPGAQATGFITVYGAQRGDLVAITHTDTAPGERFWLSAQVVAPDTLEWVLEAIDAVSLVGNFSVQVSQQ